MLIRHAEAQSEVSLDFVPMVDVLFNLLIFFLLATSLHQTEREMQIALPQARAAGPLTAALREIVVNIDRTGAMVVNGKPIDDNALASMISSAVSINPRQKLTVRADRSTAYANVARVLDISKGAGVAEPYLETLPAE